MRSLSRQLYPAGGPGGAGGGGTPGGADTQVQFNNAGAFGGSSNLTWDNSFGNGLQVKWTDTGTGSSVATSTGIVPTGVTSLGPTAYNTLIQILGTGTIDLTNGTVVGHTSAITGNSTGSSPQLLVYDAAINLPTFTVTNDYGSPQGGYFGYRLNYIQILAATDGYGVYMPSPIVGTTTNFYQYYGAAINPSFVTNGYYAWFDSNGVFRIKEDNTFNAVGQAVPALYNPQFVKYTPGAANFERVVLQWESNVATLTTEKGGTGTLRAMNLGDTGVQVKINSQNITLGGALSTGGTLTTAAGKNFTVNNTLTLAGTDSTTMTFPTTSATIARTDAGNTFTGNQTINEAVGGSGLTITGATQTSSFPALSVTQTWNNVATTFTGVLVNITNTAAAGTSLVMDLQVGGSTQFNVRKDGVVNTQNGSYRVGGGAVSVDSNGLTWSGSGYLRSDAANQYAFRNGTSAQILNVYNTFTSSTNFERLMVDWATTANTAMIYTQKGSGGGTARVLQLNYGGTTTSAISVPITSGAITFGGALTTTGASSTIASGTGIPAGGTAGTGYVFSSTANFGTFFGSGAPTLSAAKGSLYLRSDGTTINDRMYVNTDGGTTWTAVTTVG